MRKAILVLAVAVLVALPLVFGVTFAAAEAAKGVIKVDQPAERFKGGKKTKTPVEFNHDKHKGEFKIVCAECHHKEQADKLPADQKPKSCVAADCHGPAKQVVDGKTMVDAEDAYHKNCKDCHKKQKKGPKKCKECHPGAEDE